MSELLYYERNLPHWLPREADIFLTFRLADSLPISAINRLQVQFSHGEEQSYAQQRRYFGRFDALLDSSGHGPIWLAQPPVAELVGQAIRHFHSESYRLVCYCLMPNHVHMVVSLSATCPPLARTLQRLKGYTALQANKLLARTGQFWQRETYDHIVRSGEEMSRIIAYVVNNPVKAGLVAEWTQWPYTYWPESEAPNSIL